MTSGRGNIPDDQREPVEGDPFEEGTEPGAEGTGKSGIDEVPSVLPGGNVDYQEDDFADDDGYGDDDFGDMEDMTADEFRALGPRGMLKEIWKSRGRFRGWRRIQLIFAMIALVLLLAAERFLSFLTRQPSQFAGIDSFDKILAKNPRDAKALFGRGKLQADLGECEPALDDLDDAIQLGHRSAEIYRCRCRCNETLGLKEEMIADYTQVLKFEPEDSQTYFARGNTYKDLGDPENALADYAQAMHLGLRGPEIHICRAEAWRDLDDSRQALEELRASQRTEANQHPDGGRHQRRAEVFWQLGLHQDALNEMAEAIRLCDWSDWYHELRGQMLEELGRGDEAEYHFQQMEKIIWEYDNTMADKIQIVPLVQEHHGAIALDQIDVTIRSWPYRTGADLQRAFDGLDAAGLKVKQFYATQFCGQPAQEFTQLYIRDRRNPVIAVPPQYVEIDIGEDEPVRALKDGVWLVHAGKVALTVMLNPGYDGNIRIQVAARKGKTELDATHQLFHHFEQAVQKSSCYRHKVLSLEYKEMYSGQGMGILVHKLRRVDRDDVILPTRTLELLDRNVMQFIKQRPRLASLGLSLKKGLLLYGPPGTGKTHTIHYLAGSMPDHTTFLISAEQVCNLSEYMTLSRLLQPCMVVIEDVDLIARDRAGMRSAGEEVLLNKLLNEMDGLRADAEILFVLTTNRPSALEEALASRPGRIDQAIEFPLPDEDGRARLVHLYAQGVQVPDDVLRYTVERTNNVSASFIKELLRRAIQFALLNDGEDPLRIARSDVEQALDEMLVHGGALNRKLLGATEGQASGA